jgi:hypothetical protein
MGPPIVDQHDHFVPREGCHTLSVWVSLGLLALGEGPRGHEVFHHATVLEPMLDGVRVVHEGLLEESVKVVCQWPCLALDTTPGSHDVLHVRVVHFLIVVIVVAGRDCNPLGALLSPLLVALGALLCALIGNVGWRRSTAARDRFPTA